jgi:MoaA/NifB/PqqE/SkfB family radical SAM enzyme
MNTELSSGDEFYFQWHITERCNKRCRHCYQDGRPINDLPLTDLESVLGLMAEALVKWDRIGTLSFTGGEPFVRTTELFALMKQADQMPAFAFYDILTNGSLISDDVAIALKGHWHSTRQCSACGERRR